MEFFVNSERHVVNDFEPSMTLLRYLRTLAKLRGTKEGCASGDCGACTVLVADKNGYVSVNACIALLGGFAGKHVVTVDGLADSETGALHPVQKAMVDCHASQCGFCTPGFVMSLAGLYEEHRSGSHPDSHAVFDAISGNLCRCTGYRPIVEAAEKMFSHEASTPLTQLANASESKVCYYEASNDANDSEKNASAYHLPTTEKELQSLLSQDITSFLVSGGTDKVLEISQQYQTPTQVIDILGIDTLGTIQIEQDHIYIGSAVTYSQLEKLFADYSPSFVALLHRLGSRQIRNRGTLGGNIANGSPIADTPPALFVWDAEIEAVNSQGLRRWVNINDFYLGYRKTVLADDDYIANIRISKRELARPHRFYKVSKRFEDDISAVMGAFVIEHESSLCTHIRAAYGGMAATPVRALETESFLLGKALNRNNMEQAAQILADEFQPMSDVRASAAYRIEIAINLLRKAVAELTDTALSSPFNSLSRPRADHA